MSSIKLLEEDQVKIKFSKSTHRGKAVMIDAENADGESIDMHLTSKQARALAGWINSNIAKDDEGIIYED